MRRVERVARHRAGRPHADEPGRELVEVGLADRDRPGRPQPRHREGVRLRQVAKAGQAAVVGSPATSMLSLTAKGTPQSGRVGSKAPRAAAIADSAAPSKRAMKMPGSSTAASRRSTSRITAAGSSPAA